MSLKKNFIPELEVFIYKVLETVYVKSVMLFYTYVTLTFLSYFSVKFLGTRLISTMHTVRSIPRRTIRVTWISTYEKARKIIADKNIKSKEGYYELCERDNRLPINPEEQFAKFTNWIEYLNIKRVYYDLETCKNKVGENLLLYPEIKKHYLDLSIVSNELCKIDSSFPPNGLWVEYYNVNDLQDIITITNKKKKMGAIL